MSKIRNKLIIRALVISIRKAETKGTITNALYAAPYLRVIADMLAIAVGVAPSDIPPNPEHKLFERVSPVKSPFGSHVYLINEAIPFGDSDNIDFSSSIFISS